MWQLALGFIAGVLLAPKTRECVKPVVKEVVKGGMVVGRAVCSVTSNAREQWNSVVDTARKELDAKEKAAAKA